MNVGLIGCGAIGGTLAQAITQGKAGEMKLIGLCDIDKTAMVNLFNKLNDADIFYTSDFNKLVEEKKIDLIVEAASQGVVKMVAEKALNAEKHMLIMSVGVFSDTTFLNKIKNLAKKKKCKVYLPSGAICGLDGVKSASVEGIESVEIISIKNPRSLEGQPHLIENNIKIDGLTAPKTVFQGNAKDAVKGFPKSVNVAVGLSLAGIGVEKTKVTVIADPNATRTRHEIKVVGDFGELHTSVNNVLHPSNPRTSYLAALSGIRTLRKIMEPIQIGT